MKRQINEKDDQYLAICYDIVELMKSQPPENREVWAARQDMLINKKD
jgi:hypothetical protein